MFGSIFWTLLGIYLIDNCCKAWFDWSPIKTLRQLVSTYAANAERRRSLSPSERERLLELEDAEADRELARVKQGLDE